MAALLCCCGKDQQISKEEAKAKRAQLDEERAQLVSAPVSLPVFPTVSFAAVLPPSHCLCFPQDESLGRHASEAAAGYTIVRTSIDEGTQNKRSAKQTDRFLVPASISPIQWIRKGPVRMAIAIYGAVE